VSTYADRHRAEEDADIARYEEEQRRETIRTHRRKQRRLAGETTQQVLAAQKADDEANGWTMTEVEQFSCLRGEMAIERRAKLQKAIHNAETAQQVVELQRLR
jgi:hypothetical protein